MPTLTMEIKRELDRKLEQIRSNRDLTDEAKRRLIAEAWENLSTRYTEAIESAERKALEKVSKAEREVMRIRYPAIASDSEKASVRASYRGAYDTTYYAVSFIDDPEQREWELARMLSRADLTGDPELADAIFHIALENDASSVVESYLSTRPEQRKRLDALSAAREEAAAVEQELSGAKMFPLRKPPELNTVGASSGEARGVAAAYAGSEGGTEA
jgi:hypothetical protein